MNSDKANADYWSKYWEVFKIPEPININSNKLNNYTYQEFHKYFSKHISESDRGKKVLEIGCGNSVWLPYLHEYFGLETDGLDYSETACKRTEEIFKRHQLKGNIYNADMFNPPADLFEKYDFVVSFGVIEHFTNTSEALKACSFFLKPGGKIITSIPNMAGFIGIYQKWMNKKIYDLHVPINKQLLNDSLINAGFKNVRVEYIMSCAVSATIDCEYPTKYIPLKKTITLFLSRICKLIWLFEKSTHIRFPKTAFFSPNIISIAEK
jgi:cyclopropane fatty-acyl-phospholipid synthase-like methyltransferase